MSFHVVVLLTDFESKLQYQFQGSDTGVAVVLLLLFCQFFIGDKARMCLHLVVTLRPIRPALLDTCLSPHIVYVPLHLFDHQLQLLRQHNIIGIGWLRYICFFMFLYS